VVDKQLFKIVLRGHRRVCCPCTPHRSSRPVRHPCGSGSALAAYLAVNTVAVVAYVVLTGSVRIRDLGKFSPS